MRVNYSILKDITGIASPSGNEQDMVKYIKSFNPANFIFKSTRKNSCSYQANIKAEKTVFIDAHIDTVHLKIMKITPDNYVVAKPVGFDGLVTDGLILVHLNTGYKGTVTTIPPHLSLSRRKTNEVFIDFALPKKNMHNFVVGDYIIFDSCYTKIGNKSISSQGLDDKVGVFILLILMQYFDKNISKLKHNLILNFSSREETGLGSFAKVKTLKIDEIFTLDTIYVTDTELIPEYISSEINFGFGPLITRNSDDDLTLGNAVIKLAEKTGIPYQIGYTGSDNGGSNNAWFSKNIDALSQGIGIPLKHMHSPNELIHEDDIKNTAKLLQKYLSIL